MFFWEGGVSYGRPDTIFNLIRGKGRWAHKKKNDPE